MRASTRALVKGLTEEELSRSGVIIQDKTTAAAFVYFILGHAALYMSSEKSTCHICHKSELFSKVDQIYPSNCYVLCRVLRHNEYYVK